MKKVVMAVALMGAANLAVASDFNGAFAEVGGVYANTVATTDNMGKFKGNKAAGKLSLGYTHAMDQFNLGVSFTAVLGDLKFNSKAGVDAKLTDVMNISFEPGVQVAKNTLLYGKLGYAMAKLKATGATNTNKSFNGVLVGAGAKYKFYENAYVGGELTYTTYSEKDSVKPKSFQAGISIGAQF